MDSETQKNQPEETVPPVFTAKTILNAAAQQEASKALTTKFTRFVGYSSFGICAVLLGLLIWQYVETKSQQNLLLGGLVLLFLAYMIYNRLTGNKKYLRRWEETMVKNYGTGELHLTTEFYKLNLAQTLEENQEMVVESYSDLKAFRETEHLFLLQRNPSTWFFVAKDGLEGCTEEEFRSFITEHMGG